MVGYATAYTMLPVFSLVLDRDVNEDVALLYPELYKELTKVSPSFIRLRDLRVRLTLFRFRSRAVRCRTRPSSPG